MSDTQTVTTQVKLPPQVIAQMERANQLVEQLGLNSTEEAPAAPNPITGEVPQSEQTFAEGGQVEQAPLVAPEAPQAEKPIDWEHRYKSLDGRYKQLEARMRESAATIDHLEEQLETLTSPRAFTPYEDAGLTPEEQNDYGQEFLTVVGKKARAELAPHVQQLEAKVQQLEAKIGKTESVTKAQARERLFSHMDLEIPGWRKVNDNPEFQSWLALRDPYSNAIRHEYLLEAYGQNDAPRVATFFKGFLAEEAALAPAGQYQQSAPLAPAALSSHGVQVAPKIPLATLAAPGRTSIAAANTPAADKPVISRAQISQFYAQVAAGKFRNRDSERVATETMIHEATREGRIL